MCRRNEACQTYPREIGCLFLGDGAAQINPDLVLSGDVVPQFGQSEQLVEDARLEPGSSSVIFACGAARLGLRVAFVGHPYNLFDADINKDILALTKSLGMEIITSDFLSEKEISREVSDLSKEIYWSSGREIVGSLFHFLSSGVDGVIFLTSFKCGIDALLQEFIKRRLKVRGETSIPLLILSFDEHTGREGLTTRLEAFRDVIEERRSNSQIVA
jgi:hypothetical protein